LLSSKGDPKEGMGGRGRKKPFSVESDLNRDESALNFQAKKKKKKKKKKRGFPRRRKRTPGEGRRECDGGTTGSSITKLECS